MDKIQKVFATKEESLGQQVKFQIGADDDEDENDEERGQQLGADQISIEMSSTDGQTESSTINNSSLKPAFPSFNEPVPI